MKPSETWTVAKVYANPAPFPGCKKCILNGVPTLRNIKHSHDGQLVSSAEGTDLIVIHQLLGVLIGSSICHRLFCSSLPGRVNAKTNDFW